MKVLCRLEPSNVVDREISQGGQTRGNSDAVRVEDHSEARVDSDVRCAGIERDDVAGN